MPFHKEILQHPGRALCEVPPYTICRCKPHGPCPLELEEGNCPQESFDWTLNEVPVPAAYWYYARFSDFVLLGEEPGQFQGC